MIENQPHMPKGGWIAAALSAVGAAAFLLWQPLMDYFITGTYDENIVIQLEGASMKIKEDPKLLVIRVKATNKGNVPVKLIPEGKGDMTIEVHKIEKAEPGEWVDPASTPILTKKLILDAAAGNLVVPPGSYWSREVSMPLPKGTYWIKSTLNRKTGEPITEATYFEHSKQPCHD
jgi:hypothetical protein